MERAGGEAWQLTTMRNGAGVPVWAPDSTRIAFASAIRDSQSREVLVKEPVEADKKEIEKEKRDKAGVYARMMWRFDSTGIAPADRRNHIWYVQVGGPGEKCADAVRITYGDFDHGAPTWSPDGKAVAFTARRTTDELARFSDVWVTAVPAADADASFNPRNITGSIGLFADPAFSPDGKYLAVAGHEREFENCTHQKVYLFPLDGGAHRILNADWGLGLGDRVNADIRPAGHIGLHWGPESNVIYVNAEERGRSSLWQLQVAGGRPVQVAGGDREIYGASFDPNLERVAFVAADMFSPGDVYAMDLREFEESRLTSVNADLLEQIEFPQVEEITYKAPDGWNIHGWLMKPVGFEAGRQYPLVMNVHGGPATCWGHSFQFEMQLLAASGYGVVFVNPRGSTSYGEQFCNAVRMDYGGKDYLDLMAGVDYALAQGWVDARRLGITGGSYGGFMTNWAVGHTDRFAAAISHRSISNWLNFTGVSDIGVTFSESQHGVKDPWSAEGQKTLWEISPIKYVANVATPIQIMHSEFDYRCPVSEGEQFYMAVKFHGKAPTEFIRHPRSNHDLTRMGPPVLRVDRFQHILRWFGTYMPANQEGAAEG